MNDRELQKHRTFMAIAERLSWLCTCDRKSVGAVIIRNGRCISWGFNGAPPGLPHCSENDHGYSDLEGRIVQPRYSGDWGCRNATHAEANALAAAARQGISTDEATLYVTVSPCDTCSRLLIAAGIQRVFYQEEYRDRRGIETLAAACIQCSPLLVQPPGSLPVR